MNTLKEEQTQEKELNVERKDDCLKLDTNAISIKQNDVEESVVSESEKAVATKGSEREKMFTLKKIARMGIFIALGFALSFFEFPLFPLAGWLKLDFSNFVTLIAGFSLGPIPAIVVELVKQLLCLISKSSSIGIGEIANFVITTSFILPPALFYMKHKGFKMAVVSLIIGIVSQVVVASLFNAFVLMPMYSVLFHLNVQEIFGSMETYIFAFVVPFNLIKGVVIAVLALLAYKPVNKVLSKFL